MASIVVASAGGGPVVVPISRAALRCFQSFSVAIRRRGPSTAIDEFLRPMFRRNAKAKIEEMNVHFTPSSEGKLCDRVLAAHSSSNRADPTFGGQRLEQIIKAIGPAEHVESQFHSGSRCAVLDLARSSSRTAAVLLDDLSPCSAIDSPPHRFCVASEMGDDVANRPAGQRRWTPHMFVAEILQRHLEPCVGGTATRNVGERRFRSPKIRPATAFSMDRTDASPVVANAKLEAPGKRPRKVPSNRDASAPFRPERCASAVVHLRLCGMSMSRGQGHPSADRPRPDCRVAIRQHVSKPCAGKLSIEQIGHLPR